ncbi:Putative gustatory receptor 28b [Camponotus floridanus]|uniref:Putative gustatory receptor 28b n=1 Tax=Camponotus floridanus TaxID=104421 RepID=E2AGX1_CAMFO|nr:Putative gustatory receptor 28b [Camponotus floridanus]
MLHQNIIKIIYRSLCLMTCLISVQIWGFWCDLRRGWENSTRLKSQNAIIFSASDVLGLMSLMAVSIISSIIYWQQVQTIIDKLIDGKKTAVLVSQLLSMDHDREGTKQLEIFSLQLLHRPLEFTACGLFTLDRTLITSLAGAVTTYLVIIIQFQKEDNTKGNFDIILKNATQMLKNATILHNITAGRLGL